MAATPVTINGVAYPKNKKDKPFPVVIVGYAWVTGLHPEHPIELPPPAAGDVPHPEHPIVLPPDDAHPEHPIVLPPDQIPPEPPEIPMVPSEPKPPPPDGGWGWSPEYGWGYFPGPRNPGPKR